MTTERTGVNGYETLNSYATDTTVLNADGSTTETVAVSATSGGALKTKVVTSRAPAACRRRHKPTSMATGGST